MSGAKHVVFILLLAGTGPAFSGATDEDVIWSEDFNSPAVDGKGAYGPSNTVDTAGVTNWSVDVTGADLVDVEDWFKVRNSLFEARDTDGTCIWHAASISITGYPLVQFSVDLSEAGTMEGGDSIGVYYSIDGGPEQTGTVRTDDFDAFTYTKYALTGATLQITVKANNSSADEYHRFDNVIVSESAGNQPPNLSLSIAQTSMRLAEGNRIVVEATATEPDNDDITLSAAGLPRSASFGPVTGKSPVSDTLDWIADLPGEFEIVFTAIDQDGSSTATVQVAVVRHPRVWLNEVHYDDTNAGGDTNEGVEVAGRAGLSLEDYEVWLYNGVNGDPYSPHRIALSGQLDNEMEGYGAVWFPQAGIQNGAPDGLALVYAGNPTAVVDFVSYEGDFQAETGPAAPLWSIDLGVAEDPPPVVDRSLQLTGAGSAYADFTWTGPATQSRGRLNDGQRIVKAPTILMIR